MQKLFTLLIFLIASFVARGQTTSLDLDFSDPAHADRFNFIFDSGGEVQKTVEDGAMKIVLNKKEWHFFQVWVNPFDFINNPFIHLRIKADQPTPIRMWLKQPDGAELTVIEQTIQASADYQTIAFAVANAAPLTGDLQEIGIDIGGYQVPPATFAGTVYIDEFKLGQAAQPNSSLDLEFTDPTEASRLNYIFDTGGEVTKTVTDGVLKIDLQKKEWHFFQIWIKPFNFISNPYFRLKLKVDQSTPLRIWLTQDGGVSKDLFNQIVEPTGDFQTIQVTLEDLVPLTSYVQELNLDIGGYQVPPAVFAGSVYIDEIKLGEVAKPATEVFGTGYQEDFSSELSPLWSGGEGFNLSRDGESLKFDISRDTPVPDGEMSKLPSLHFDGKVLDVSANPYVNIDVRGNDPFMLSVIAVDNNNQRKEYKARVVKTDQFHTVSFNLASLTGIDLSAIQRFYLGFNRAGFAFRSTVWFDRISIGEGAANLATIDAIPDKKYYKDSGEQEITLTHIKDASSVSLAGSPALIENISISPITNGTAKLGFTLKPGAIGQETITLTANGSGGYQDNTTSFDLTIEGNNPPTLGSIGHLQLEAKAKARVTLTGISDGNATIEQPLSFKVLSSDPKVAKGNVEYSGEGPEATLHVSGLKKGKATLTVQVKDNGDGTSSVNVPFEVEVFNNLNGAPTIDQPGNLEVYQDAGPITITLTGIDHGGRKKERLNITATHSNAEVLTDLQVEYEQGSETASLTFTPIPAATGTSTVNVVLSDDGGNGSNNGNQSTTVQFDVTVLQRPVTGYIASLDKETEGFSSNDKYTITEVDSAGFKALIFQATDKFYWDGVMMNLPQELDLSENPYLTMEVYPVSQNTLHWIWFYDVTGARNELNNLSGDHIQQAIAGQWNKLVFDFSGENDWVNNGTNAPINNKRINRILFDMHNAYFSWPPPPNYTGTFIIRNLRVGSAADFQKVATTTIHPVADQVLFTNQESQSITLSGISDGNGSHAGVSVSVENSNSSAVVNPIVSDVNDEGIATLSFATGLTPGESTVTITVSAEGATSSSMSFKVQTLHADAASAANVTIDPSKRFQRMYGFGSFSIDEANIDFYTKEMGGTAMRVGIISNQFEPVNDNDDPHVLNLEGFNYSAFNWDALKELKAKGVQNFILTSWSPPAWMKTNLSVDYFQAGYTKDTDGTDNRLDYTMYEEFAESMVAIVKAFQQRAGIDLLAIGLQNEPAFHEPYPSAILGPDKFVELIKVVGRRFRAEGIDTRLYMAEQVSMFVDDNNLYLNTLQADAEANSYCDIFALHGYGSDGITPGQPNFSEWQNYRANAAEGDHPKDVWMTETHKDYNSFVDALQIAGAIYGALEHGDVSLWTQWGFEGPFVQQGKPTGMLYTMSNFSRFIKPGDVRVESVSAHEDVLVTTFINEESNEYASVLINKGNAPLSVNLQGIDLSGDVAVFNTAENRNLQAHPQLTDGVLLLPAKSVTTLTNKSFATESQQTLQDRSATARSNEGQRFNVYPNPSNGFFYLETDEQVDEVDIVDLYGVSKRKVKLQAGEMTVPVAGLRPGIYILNMKSKEGSRKQRIVIE